jgi:hypothetical protein
MAKKVTPSTSQDNLFSTETGRVLETDRDPGGGRLPHGRA